MSGLSKIKRKIRRANNLKINVFACKVCKHEVVTVDLCVGSTPGSIICPKCQETSMLSFYPDSVQNRKPKFGWFKPANDVILKEQIEWECEWSGVPVTDEKKELCFKLMKGRVKNGSLCLREL